MASLSMSTQVYEYMNIWVSLATCRTHHWGMHYVDSVGSMGTTLIGCNGIRGPSEVYSIWELLMIPFHGREHCQNQEMWYYGCVSVAWPFGVRVTKTENSEFRGVKLWGQRPHIKLADNTDGWQMCASPCTHTHKHHPGHKQDKELT